MCHGIASRCCASRVCKTATMRVRRSSEILTAPAPGISSSQQISNLVTRHANAFENESHNAFQRLRCPGSRIPKACHLMSCVSCCVSHPKSRPLRRCTSTRTRTCPGIRSWVHPGEFPRCTQCSTLPSCHHRLERTALLNLAARDAAAVD